MSEQRRLSRSQAAYRRVCAFDVTDKIKNFLAKGWLSTSASFTGKFAKDRTVSPSADDSDIAMMKLLASTREYIVQKSFECHRTKGQSIIVTGSENPTSDYDATLMGSGSVDTMWGMFMDFLRTYGTSLPQAFDVNLYTTGVYLIEADTLSSEGMNVIRKDFRFKKGDALLPAWTVCPLTPEQSRNAEVWAAVKVVENGDSYPDETIDKLAKHRALTMRNMLQRAVEVVSAMDGITANSDLRPEGTLRTRVLAKTKIRSEYVVILAKYALQHYFGTLFNARTNSEFSPSYPDELLAAVYDSAEFDRDAHMDVIDLLCHARYFAIEGAYTQGNVNVVVIEGQMKVPDLDLAENDYLCSVIENYADFVKHAKDAAGQGVQLLEFAIKFSKYVMRMLDGAVGISAKRGEKQSAFKPLRDRFATGVYAHRSSDLPPPTSILNKRLYTVMPVGGSFDDVDEMVLWVRKLFNFIIMTYSEKDINIGGAMLKKTRSTKGAKKPLPKNTAPKTAASKKASPSKKAAPSKKASAPKKAAAAKKK